MLRIGVGGGRVAADGNAHDGPKYDAHDPVANVVAANLTLGVNPGAVGAARVFVIRRSFII